MGPFDNLPKPNLPDLPKLPSLPTPSLPSLPKLGADGTTQIGRGAPIALEELIVSVTDTSGFLGGFKWILFFG